MEEQFACSIQYLQNQVNNVLSADTEFSPGMMNGSTLNVILCLERLLEFKHTPVLLYTVHR